MPSYAPTNEEGLKPYIVVEFDWGKTREHLVYASDAADAKWKAVGRVGPGRYASSCRRATPEDIDARR